MGKDKKIAKKHHFDTKIPCPSCGERIGFVQSTCPFCNEPIPLWSDKAAKIVLGIGFFLASGYLVSMFYFWDEYPGLFFASFGRAFLWLAVVFALGERASRY